VLFFEAKNKMDLIKVKFHNDNSAYTVVGFVASKHGYDTIVEAIIVDKDGFLTTTKLSDIKVIPFI
jgi:hypothetical protein